MNAFGVVLQIIGLVVAIGALVWELTAAHAPHAVALPDPLKMLARVENPWGQSASGQPMTSFGAGNTLGHRMNNPSPGAQAQALARQIDGDRFRAHKGWDAQVTALGSLAQANQEILAAQLAQVTTANKHMKVRVAIEMTGLIVTVIGTVLAAR